MAGVINLERAELLFEMGEYDKAFHMGMELVKEEGIQELH